ncbi:hypothetical protein G7074_09440 [Pedobacter sp. HDW13]|uniref:hypothetical protein n=1 Tax=Pedobacter sp. HDW13 TaxID=2714940 RepID=UPI001408C508|nr:hypothetical protein [Pedobacter sp. HDW13]QIL39476.1 hypothetical protein G7074_09440 [Pedobacter sp. HDW13]
MKKLLSLMVLLFIAYTANAQSHISKSEYSRYNCRFAPKGSNNAEGKLMCPACAKENEDARKKKIADDKAQSELGKIKNAKLKAEAEIAFKKQRAEVAERSKVTEVHVTMGKTPLTAGKTPEKPAKKAPLKLTKDVLFFADYPGSMSMNGNRLNYFLNENGDTILKSKDYYSTFGAFSDNKNNFPKNLGIVVLNEENTLTNGKTRKIADLVDSKGKRLFKDKSISTIFHLMNDYFVIGRSKDFGEDSSWGYNYRRIQEVDIYNTKTRKTITLDKDRRNVEIYVAFDHRKLEDEGLKPVLLRRYINYDEDIYCLNAAGELVVKNYKSSR